MARKAVNRIDWAAIARGVIPEEQAMYAAFKATSDGYLRRMTANPEAPPKLDWDYYRKNIMIPGLVDRFQKEYEALSIPYPEDKYTHLIDAKAKEYAIETEEYIKEGDEDIKRFEKEIEKIRNMIPVEDMLLEDFVQYHPELNPYDPKRPKIWPGYPEHQYHLTGEYEKLEREEKEAQQH